MKRPPEISSENLQKISARTEKKLKSQREEFFIEPSDPRLNSFFFQITNCLNDFEEVWGNGRYGDYFEYGYNTSSNKKIIVPIS